MDSDSLRSIALDWLGFDSRPRMIVSADRAIHWINQRARDVLAQVPAVQIARGRLAYRAASDDTQFEHYLQRTGSKPGTMALPFDGGSSHLLFRGRYLADTDVFCLEISLDHAAYRPALADFAEVFGLTSSEAKTAVALFEGQSVTDVASLHKVSVGTVRTHVRQIYAKLGTGNREQFFRRLQPFRVV